MRRRLFVRRWLKKHTIEFWRMWDVCLATRSDGAPPTKLPRELDCGEESFRPEA